jgi:hypothetical protein
MPRGFTHEPSTGWPQPYRTPDCIRYLDCLSEKAFFDLPQGQNCLACLRYEPQPFGLTRQELFGCVRLLAAVFEITPL